MAFSRPQFLAAFRLAAAYRHIWALVLCRVLEDQGIKASWSSCEKLNWPEDRPVPSSVEEVFEMVQNNWTQERDHELDGETDHPNFHRGDLVFSAEDCRWTVGPDGRVRLAVGPVDKEVLSADLRPNDSPPWQWRAEVFGHGAFLSPRPFTKQDLFLLQDLVARIVGERSAREACEFLRPQATE